ncbi:MAG TPA: DUF3097 domain-containing protein [Actinocrinis sp.]|jgi:hypothetical protein|uniref:DUF3097 domain-containing protein n=1 Tax=Actinocrinis sp. TaxID=1920516 RepID=UPI002DDD8AC1|nr:DUF3097 domain-containing protein [Actinocrinis sp.]HEV3173753.1 DUF3097 domain-containing protein [Actinocrinis sp.]
MDSSDRPRAGRTDRGPAPKRYGPADLLPSSRAARPLPEVEAVTDLVIEEVTTGFCGAVVRVEKTPGGFTVTLEDRFRKHRVFPLGPGFLLEGKPVVLVRPKPQPNNAQGTARTASGSRAVAGLRARVARGGRIYVEGKHDAELVERVWGADLRIEGVVVELLDGVDLLPGIVEQFAPEPGRRLGVLVDHMVANSKETRIAGQVQKGREDSVLVLGHPYVDIWQAVKPSALGFEAWPRVPRTEEWKRGVCERLRRKDPTWPLEPREAWPRVLGAVNSYKDLEPELLGRVEALIDFVTTPA